MIHNRFLSINTVQNIKLSYKERGLSHAIFHFTAGNARVSGDKHFTEG